MNERLIRDGLRRGMGEITHAQVRANLDSSKASGEFQVVERASDRAVSSQPRRLSQRNMKLSGECVRDRTMPSQLFHVSTPSSPLPISIRISTQAQKSVIEDVLSSPDRIQGIQGFAGSGKTTTLTVIRSAAETQGYQVEGFAPTSRAARQLKQAGVHAGTLQGFLARRQNPEPSQSKSGSIFVDESSLASTNQMREFLARIGSNDRVLLIGDTRQHQGVEAGRPFEQLQEAGMRTAKLDEIVRQQDPALKSTVEMLAHGQTAAAIEALQERGRVKQIVDPQERIQAIAQNYVASPERTLIVSPDNASRQELNRAVRQELKAIGALKPEDHIFVCSFRART